MRLRPPSATTLAVLAAAALAALAAPASAHVTTTVDPLQTPLVVGQATDVTVHFSEPCFEAVPQQAQGQDTIMTGLDPGAPPTILWQGETVPFSMDQCDPSAVPLAQVRATATLTLIATADAPGLTKLALPVTSYLGGGSEPGENVSLEVTIAHHANGTVHASAAKGHDAHAAGPNATAIDLFVEVTTNAPSLLTFEAVASTGTVREVDAIAVDPPAYANRSTSRIEALAAFDPPAAWTNATLTFQAYLTPTVGGPRILVGNATLTLENDAMGGAHGDGHGDGHRHDHAQEEDAPGPGLAPLALAFGAAAGARRRGPRHEGNP